MPVQINEMVIRANILEGTENERDLIPHASGNNNINKDELIRECAALVMEIINSKSER